MATCYNLVWKNNKEIEVIEMAKYNNKNTLELMKQLTTLDKKTCCLIYQYQFLTEQQIYDAIFNEEEEYETFLDGILERLIGLGLLERDKDQSNYIYLTTTGINVVREVLELADNVITTSNKMIERHYYRASKLRPKPQNLARQALLNQSVRFIENSLKHHGGVNIAFKSNLIGIKKEDYKFSYKYIDQRHINDKVKYLQHLKPHSAFIKKVGGEIHIQSIIVLDSHMNDLLIKAVLNKYVKKHLESSAYKKEYNETLYLLADDTNKPLFETYIYRVKEEYEEETFKIELVTPFELFGKVNKVLTLD